MTDDIVVIFAEGPTEIEFYKAVVAKANKLSSVSYSCQIEYINMKGIGQYKTKALKKFKHLKNIKPNSKFNLFLCIDNDVFQNPTKSPFDKDTLEKNLKKAGAANVKYIIANQSIEDWFLSDLEGVLDYLKLPKTTKRPSGNGQEALKKLFKKKNKLYVKGTKAEGFIERLDLLKIIKIQCKSFEPLCKSLGFECKKVCGMY